jgi:uncharacterized protein YndB with AHSA1/START domain
MAQLRNDTATVSLPSDTQILITRELNAPKHLVYRAYTTPELIKRWWAGDRGEVTDVEVDLRVGGRWRYAMIANGGFDVAFHGEYLEVVETERLVYTAIFDDVPEEQAVNTLTLTERDGVTWFELLVQHSSQEHRDTQIRYGMEGGMQEAMNYLEGVAISLA